MTQEPQKNNTVLIIIAIIGVVGTIIASVIGAVGNYNTEKMRQEAELTRIALVSIVTQGGATQASMASTISAPTGTPYPTPTYTLSPTSLPTETAIPTPTATFFVPPTDGILFQDNFDTQISSEWVFYSGKWFVSNGKLTKLTDDNTGNDYQWITLNKPEWRNYILSVDINKSWTDSVVVAVRSNTSNLNLLGFTVSRGNYVNLVFISNNWVDNTLVAGNSEVEISPKNDYSYQIEVQGDIYVLRLNGREIQRISMSGYESGGITFGVNCYNASYGCTTFDNVKVTYLP